jgi:hypothetical protein
MVGRRRAFGRRLGRRLGPVGAAEQRNVPDRDRQHDRLLHSSSRTRLRWRRDGRRRRERAWDGHPRAVSRGERRTRRVGVRYRETALSRGVRPSRATAPTALASRAAATTASVFKAIASPRRGPGRERIGRRTGDPRMGAERPNRRDWPEHRSRRVRCGRKPSACGRVRRLRPSRRDGNLRSEPPRGRSKLRGASDSAHRVRLNPGRVLGGHRDAFVLVTSSAKVLATLQADPGSGAAINFVSIDHVGNAFTVHLTKPVTVAWFVLD